MSHHFTRNTESATKWCNQCNRVTEHAVSGGRIGRCMEHDAPLYPQTQLRKRERLERERQKERQMKLFEARR